MCVHFTETKEGKGVWHPLRANIQKGVCLCPPHTVSHAFTAPSQQTTDNHEQTWLHSRTNTINQPTRSPWGDMEEGRRKTKQNKNNKPASNYTSTQVREHFFNLSLTVLFGCCVRYIPLLPSFLSLVSFISSSTSPVPSLCLRAQDRTRQPLTLKPCITRSNRISYVHVFMTFARAISLAIIFCCPHPILNSKQANMHASNSLWAHGPYIFHRVFGESCE